jgi:hypothetical protein
MLQYLASSEEEKFLNEVTASIQGNPWTKKWAINLHEKFWTSSTLNMKAASPSKMLFPIYQSKCSTSQKSGLFIDLYHSITALLTYNFMPDCRFLATCTT